MVHTIAPRSNFALISPVICNSHKYNKTGKQVNRFPLSRFSQKSIVALVYKHTDKLSVTICKTAQIFMASLLLLDVINE